MPNSNDVLSRARHADKASALLITGRTSYWTLPAEIWLEVISHARPRFPAVFADSNEEDVIAFTRDVSGRCSLASYNKLLQTRLAISQVCKAFRQYAEQTTFEFVFIRHSEQVLALASLLDRQISSNSTGLGWWTRRLELRLVDCGQSWTALHTAALHTIFSHCPNISTFSSVLASPLDLAPAAFPNLRRLELTCDLSSALSTLAPLSDSLETLWLTLTRRPSYNYRPVKMPFPRLHTLIFTRIYVPEITEEWDMPSLRTFIADDNSWPDQTIVENGEQMITQHGENIHRLGIVTPIVFWTALHLCPNMVELTVTCRVEGALFNQMLHYLSYLFPFRCPSLRSVTLEGCPIAVANDLSLEKTLNALALAGRNEPEISALTGRERKIAEPLPLSRVRMAFVGSPDKLMDMLPEMVPTKESVGWNAFLNVCKARNILLETSCGQEELFANVWHTVLPQGRIDEVVTMVE